MSIKDSASGSGPQLLFSREDLSNALLDQPRWAHQRIFAAVCARSARQHRAARDETL
jgi:hypothetical protein